MAVKVGQMKAKQGQSSQPGPQQQETVLKTKNLDLTIRKANDARKRGTSSLIYGESGVGKTSLIRTLPPKETLMFNIDAGDNVIRDVKGLDVIDITTQTDLRAIKLFYNKLITREVGPYKYCVVDSVSEEEKWMRNVITDSKGKIFPTIKELGEASFKLSEYSRMFRDLVYHGMDVFFIAAEKRDDIQNDVDGVVTKGVPYLSKQMVIDICCMVDIVAHMERDQKSDVRWFRLESNQMYFAKCRYPWLGKFEKPNLKLLMDKIKEGGSYELSDDELNRDLNEMAKGERPDDAVR